MSNQKNQQALDNPRPGDYWHERFSPYFVIVNQEGDQFRVLSCMGGPHHYLRKHELNARIEIDRDHWAFDYSKSMLVDREWIRRAVILSKNISKLNDEYCSNETGSRGNEKCK